MKCPICEHETKVINSRPASSGTTRRRECPECLTRFSTRESIEINSLENFLQKQISQGFTEKGLKKVWTEKETEQLTLTMHLKKQSY
jgi:transcriptional regulator NrdR family protein